MLIFPLACVPGPLPSPPMISAIAASLALLVSLINFIVTYRTSRRIKRLDFKASIIKSRQDLYRDIRIWAEAVIKVMTDGATLCEYDPQKMKEGEMFNKCRQLVSDLSYLMDRGKLYLPNNDADKHGTHKPGAYRGLRQEALNIIGKYLELAKNDLSYKDQPLNKAKLQRPFIDLKRDFVSEIQNSIEVRRINAEIEDLVKQMKAW